MRTGTLRLLLAPLALLGACGGGGGGDGTPPPAPTVTACSGPLAAHLAQSFTVSGADFPGVDGQPVTVRFVAEAGRLLGACGVTMRSTSGTRTSPGTVTGSLPTFVLTRDVAASVELDFGGGVVAASPGTVVTFTGMPDTTVDHDLDGTPDACDPRTLTFEADALGARPAGATSWDGNGALLATRAVGARRAAAYAATADVPYDRFDALRLDHPQQDVDVYLDVEDVAGVLNLELWSDGSFRGLSGAGLIIQVRASGQLIGYQRLWQVIQTSVPGPVLPANGRLRLRVRKGAGSSSTVHHDLWNGSGWDMDASVWTIPDDRQFRGQETTLCNYLVDPATRGLDRITVVPLVPAAPLTVSRSPLHTTDHVVFQRDAGDAATIPLRLLLRPSTAGTVQARVVASATGLALAGHDWGAHALAVPARPDGMRADLALPAVPVGGNYDVQVRLLDSDGAVVAAQVVRDVAVGDVWLAAGQSNMAGYSGSLFGADVPRPEVHLFGNDGRWKEAREPVDDGADQTDVVSYETPAVSCLLAFGKALVAATGVPVGIVPTPLGGTNLHTQWQRDAAHPAARQTLYGSMLHRARTACPATPPRGLLWFQGESDALAGRSEAQYAADLGALVAALRSDLAAPGLVFLCGQLGTFDAANLAQWLPVQEAQREVVLADPAAALATAVDLPRSDGIHFNVVGYGLMGQRFALGARRLVFGHGVDPTTDLVSAQVGVSGTSVVLTFEAVVTGGATSLFRVADAGGDVPVIGLSTSGTTVTLTLSRALLASPAVSYGWSVDPSALWLRDAAGAAVPVFYGVALAP
jgi:sialate O-acetylesterase